MPLPRLQKKTIYLLLILSFFLSTCAPLPKEGEYKETVQVNLKLQHRSNLKSTRTGSETRISEFLVLAQADTPFRQSGPLPEELADPEAIYEVIGDEVKGVSVQLGESYSVFIFRFGFPLNQDDFKSFWQYGDVEFSVSDYGKGTLEIPNELPEQGAALSLDIQLQREAIFIDSVVWGLSYQAGDRINDTNEDGLIFYFPGEEIKLWLANIPLGTFDPNTQFSTTPRILTPYSIFGEQEGTYSDRVINFVRLLLSVDWDQNPENGIRIDHDQVDQLPVKSLDDFSDNSLFTGLRISAEYAKRHLASSMRVKNFPESAFDVIVTVPGDQDDHAFVEGVIAVAFTENLRSSSINEGQILVSDAQGNAVEGYLRLDRNWLIFQPFSPLEAFQTYQVFLEPGIYSQSGKRLESGLAWSFTTEDHLDLRTYEFPEDNSSNVPIDTTISLNLDGPIFQGSQDVRWQLELDNGTQIPCQTSFQLISVSCIPTVTLPTNDNLSVTLLQGSIQILNGIDIPDLSWKFSTGSSMSLVGPALEHLGEFNDNVTGSNVVLLRVGDGGPQYQLGQGEAPSARDELWAAPMYYPIQVTFFLDDAEGDQQVQVWYREEDGTLLDNRSINITLDQEPPAGLITILDDGHHSPFNYLVMANDNLSGAWRYLISDIPDYRPMPDSEEWIYFPETPLDPSTRQELFNRSDLLQYPLNDLIALSSSVQNYDPIQDNDQGFASLDNFSQLLPVWDNGSFTLSDPNAEWITLYIQDRAGNIEGYSLGNPTEGNLDYEGDGSQTNPYLVYDANELQAIGASTTSLSAHYQLAGNIDLTGVTWTPIGTSTTPFSGSLRSGYDPNTSQSFRINNLMINSAASHQGIFGHTQNAEFRNLWLDNVTVISTNSHVGGLVGFADNTTFQYVEIRIDNITGASNVGGLAGEINNSSIQNSYSFSTSICNPFCGEITASGSNVGGLVGKLLNSQLSNTYSGIQVRVSPASSSTAIGGLVGFLQGSTIEYASSGASMTAGSSDQVGGLVGAMQNSTITRAGSYGSVTGANQVGGLIGAILSGTGSLVEYAYRESINQVTGTTKVGGLVGSVANDGSSIKNTYSVSAVSGSSDMGGLVGLITSPSSVINSYYDNQTSNQNDTAKGEPRSTKQLQETLVAGGAVDGQQTYVGWDFDNSVYSGTICDYPRLWGDFYSCAIIDGFRNPYNVTTSTYPSIQVAFSKPLNFSTINGNSAYISHNSDSNKNPKIAGYLYDNASQLLTITLAARLDNTTYYTLKLTNGISSQNGESYYGSSHPFTTNSDSFDLNQGLIAYYALDNNTLDQSGNNLGGSKVGAVSFSTDRLGQADQSVELSGNSQYITVAHDSKLNLDNLTISAWINADNVSGLRGIVSKFQNNSGNSPILLRVNSGKLNIDNTVESADNLSSNQWHHLTMTRQGNTASTTIQLYIDGSPVSWSGTPLNLSALDTDNLTIGSDYTLSGENRFFDGKIDEVKIYNRVLSADEVKALYAIDDTLQPVVTNSSPTNGAAGFPAGDNLTVDFSEPLLGSSLSQSSVELKFDNGTLVAGGITYEESTLKLIFDPSSTLPPSENYSLYLHSGIQDLAGNPLKPSQISFQTGIAGSGTATDPFLISNASGLNKIRDNLTAHYKLTSDIDLSGISWTPIGSDTTPFSGTLTGDNHTITNLHISSPSSNYIGFFGQLDGEVKELKFQNASISGLNNVGLLAGRQILTSSLISRIQADNVSVTINGLQTGGLAGYAKGQINKVKLTNLSITDGTCDSSKYQVGGLVGWLGGGTIDESSASGNITTCRWQTGGLVGKLADNGSIFNSYASVDISGTGDRRGGLVGEVETATPTQRIHKAYSTGEIVGSSLTGGAVGRITSTAYDVQSVYYDNQTSGQSDTGKGIGATTAQLQQTQDNTTAIFSGWDFVNVWDPCSTSEYPRLRWEPNRCGGTSSTILVTLSPDNLTLNENSGSATITATLSSPATDNTTITLLTMGSATRNSDYTLSADNLTILTGSLSASSTLTLINDNLTEGDETILIEIVSVSGGNGAAENGTQQVSITIIDDDNLTTVIEPTYSVDNFTVTVDNSSTITTRWELLNGQSGQAPEGFLLLCSESDNLTAPTDNVSIAEDNQCADGTGAVYLGDNQTQFTWLGLDANQDYYFTIYSYANNNSVPNYFIPTTVTLRAYDLNDNATSSSTPITNAEKQAGTFTEINDSTITSRGWTMTDTGATYSVEVGKSCYSWSRTTATAHTVNGVYYPAGHYHYNAADNTSYTNGVYNWTEYGPEHSQSEIDTTCAAGTGGVVKTANSDNYTADVTIYLKIDNATLTQHTFTANTASSATSTHFGETLSAGANYTCAVLDNGSAMCWGNNGRGKLGNGSSANDNVTTPGSVLNLSNVRSISAGLETSNSHTCAVLDNGSASCWGNNNWGQLGNGSPNNSFNPYPVAVNGLGPVIK